MSNLRDLLTPSRLTHVVDVGANPVTNGQAYTPPYAPMLTQGLCHLTGFEPQSHALADLLGKCGPNEQYLPYAVGDGGAHTLNVTRSQGMTSLLTPDQVNLKVLGRLHGAAEVVERIPMQTRRLDDIAEIEHLDFLKIDIQGGELAVFQNGRNRLAECVAVQVEVAFVTFYEGQPTQGDIDAELRGQGFVPHCFAEMKKWPIAPSLLMPMNQILEADIVYVRDFFHPDAMTDEQLKHLALIAQHCYKSFDLAIRCVQLLEDRGAVEAGTTRRYTSQPAAGPAAASAQPIAGPEMSAAAVAADAPRGPGDAHSVFALAQQHFDRSDFTEARELYLQRIGMGGSDQEIYCSLYGLAESMANLGAPWQDVQDVYLRAYKSRPTRAEPLHAVARRLREDGQYEQAYLLATRAAEIPLPEGDLLVDADVYEWGVLDVRAACAPFVRPLPEVFTLWGRLLARPDLPDDERAAIVAKRSSWMPALADAASAYPQEVPGDLAAGSPDAELTVSLIAGADRAAIEKTLNSFLNCCTDVSRAGRFLVADAGLSAEDRTALQGRYKFTEFIDCDPSGGPEALLAAIRAHVGGRFWFHLGRGWQFFAPENLITRLTGVLDAEPRVAQVGVNFADADTLTGTCAIGESVRYTPEAGRYVLTDAVATGPALFDTERLDRAGGVGSAELTTASLDEVHCTVAVRPTRVHCSQSGSSSAPIDLASLRFAVVSPEPDGYHSFDDFAETLHHALVALGHDSVMTKSLDLGGIDGRCPILLSPNYIARFGIAPPPNSILYNFEQIYADSPWMTPALFDLFLRFPVWDYSQANIDRFASWGVPRLTHVPVGYVPEMTRIAPAPKDVDVLFYGRIDERRTALLDRLRARGLRVEALNRVYGAERDAWIARSKVVVNIHAGRYTTPVFEIARVSHLLANSCAVVSEGGSNPDDRRGLESAIAFADYDGLVDRCVELVNDDRARNALAERGFQIFSARSESEILRAALSATFEQLSTPASGVTA